VTSSTWYILLYVLASFKNLSFAEPDPYFFMFPMQLVLTIFAPMIYTAPCVRFLMWADRLRGEGGGVVNLLCSTFVKINVKRVAYGHENIISL
jgi:hypothetical protein